LDKPKVLDSPPIKKAKVINNGGKNKEKRKDIPRNVTQIFNFASEYVVAKSLRDIPTLVPPISKM
jgi:hypothetical protein